MFPTSLCTCFFWSSLSLCHPVMSSSVSWILGEAWSGLRSCLPVLILSQAAFSQLCRSVSSPPISPASLAHFWQEHSFGSLCSTTLLINLDGSSPPNRTPSHTDPVDICFQPVPSYGPILSDKVERVGSIKATGCRSVTPFVLNFTNWKVQAQPTCTFGTKRVEFFRDQENMAFLLQLRLSQDKSREAGSSVPDPVIGAHACNGAS